MHAKIGKVWCGIFCTFSFQAKTVVYTLCIKTSKYVKHLNLTYTPTYYKYPSKFSLFCITKISSACIGKGSKTTKIKVTSQVYTSRGWKKNDYSCATNIFINTEFINWQNAQIPYYRKLRLVLIKVFEINTT